MRPHKFQYSETFIEDHIAGLSSSVEVVFGTPLPFMSMDDRPILSKRTLRVYQTTKTLSKVFDAYTSDFANYLKEKGIRVVLAEFSWAAMRVFRACERAGIPLVVHFHGNDAYDKAWLTSAKSEFPKLFASAHSVIVVSKAMQRQVLSLGADPERLILAPYGVDVNHKKLASPERRPFRILTVGRFVEKKAPQIAIQAFASAFPHNPELRLSMIGDGPLHQACKSLAERLGVSDYIEFCGVCDRAEVSRRMSDSNCFFQHSVTAKAGDSEGLPLAILEAGAHGLPVLSTRHAGIPDAVRENVDGYLVNEYDLEGATKNLLKLSLNTSRAKAMGQSFNRRIIQHYSREVSLGRLRAILGSAVTGLHYRTEEAADETAVKLFNIDRGVEPSVLVSFHTDPNYMKPFRVSPKQYVCGPFCSDGDVDGMPSLQTEKGCYDIGDVISRIPAGERPDLVVVKADATRLNFPSGLGNVRVPKVLIIGDTQHCVQPLQTMIGYVGSEPYDIYLSDHKRHHLHWFAKAGIRNLFWLPGFAVNDWRTRFLRNRDKDLVFIGQNGDLHPWRRRVLRRLEEYFSQLMIAQLPQREASQFYQTSAVSLNLSLNGDLNLRTFEILEAGGFLLMDRLPEFSGIDLLFERGKEFDDFESEEELVEKIQKYLSEKETAMAIAAAGYRRFRREHTSAHKMKELLTLVETGEIRPEYCADLDFRVQSGPMSTDSLFSDICIYEWFQEAHRLGDSFAMLLFENVRVDLAASLSDLPRLKLYRRDELTRWVSISDSHASPQSEKSFLMPSGERVCVGIGVRDLQTNGGIDCLLQIQPKIILLTDMDSIPDASFKKQFADLFARMGYSGEKSPEGVFVRLD